jgi:hypothetical protein
MNEEQLASALSTHIDAMLTGHPTAVEDAPEELPELLSLAGQLATIELPPHPSFGPKLKKSLLDRQRGGKGSPGGWGGMPGTLLLGLVAIILALGAITITAALTVTLLIPQPTPHLNLTPPHVPPTGAGPMEATTTAFPTPLPTLTPQMPPAVTPTVFPTKTPSPTTTLIPTLPSTVDTVQTTPVDVTVELGDLLPGLPSGSNDLPDSDDHGGSPGDHNRGHGNDDDHHDDDNPGREHGNSN